MLPILKDYKQFLKCQDLFYRFSIILGEKIPPNTSAVELLARHKYFMNKEPELTDHIYQTALEAAFYKKRFPDADLEEMFSRRFKIMDPYALNKGLSDVSTVNSMFIMERILKQNHFQNQPIIVYSTPLEYNTPLYKLRQSQGAFTYYNDSKNVTKNSNADLRIGHRIYDIKHTTQTATAQSHIYPWTYERMQSHLEQYFLSLLENLKTRSDSGDIHKTLLKELRSICGENSKTWFDKNTEWNQFVDKHFNRIPKDYPLPMIIQMTDYPYTPKHEKYVLDKVRVSPDIIDDHMKARRAIAGICANFGIEHIRRAAFATEGAISMDILPSKEEVD